MKKDIQEIDPSALEQAVTHNAAFKKQNKSIAYQTKINSQLRKQAAAQAIMLGVLLWFQYQALPSTEKYAQDGFDELGIPDETGWLSRAAFYSNVSLDMVGSYYVLQAFTAAIAAFIFDPATRNSKSIFYTMLFYFLGITTILFPAANVSAQISYEKHPDPWTTNFAFHGSWLANLGFLIALKNIITAQYQAFFKNTHVSASGILLQLMEEKLDEIIEKNPDQYIAFLDQYTATEDTSEKLALIYQLADQVTELIQPELSKAFEKNKALSSYFNKKNFWKFCQILLSAYSMVGITLSLIKAGTKISTTMLDQLVAPSFAKNLLEKSPNQYDTAASVAINNAQGIVTIVADEGLIPTLLTLLNPAHVKHFLSLGVSEIFYGLVFILPGAAMVFTNTAYSAGLASNFKETAPILQESSSALNGLSSGTTGAAGNAKFFWEIKRDLQFGGILDPKNASSLQTIYNNKTPKAQKNMLDFLTRKFKPSLANMQQNVCSKENQEFIAEIEKTNPAIQNSDFFKRYSENKEQTAPLLKEVAEEIGPEI